MDLDAYFARIGFPQAAHPDRATLFALHLAHAQAVPFENLDIQMGLPISLELADLEDKIVRRRRGGYCFEQNTLFMAVLREIGFAVEPFEARVRLGAPEVHARTHMLLRIEVAEQTLLADVGFGLQGPLEPVPMDGKPHPQQGDIYRVVAEGAEYVLQWARPAPHHWLDLYAFVPEARPAVDFVMGNHFTSTFPRSPFVTSLVAQLPTPGARYSLRNLTFSIVRGEEVEERQVTPAEARGLLGDRFGLQIPKDAPLRALSLESAGPIPGDTIAHP
jgi:N-hydroxyarylamine O-acetyltransferase